MSTMPWLALSYSLPPGPSSRRVALWRRLRRLGTLAGPGGVYLLPDLPECLESLQWLADEIRQSGGEAWLTRAERAAGLSDGELRRRFSAARDADWAVLEKRLAAIEPPASRVKAAARRAASAEALRRIRREHGALARIDFYPSGRGPALAGRLDRLERALRREPAATDAPPAAATLAAYRGRRWVTRPRPHVDRLACVWLIRRFIDSRARIRYADRARPGEVRFDMPGAEFGHGGGRCSFETMAAAFALSEPALAVLGGIVGAIDLGEPLAHPAAEGVGAVLDGWRRTEWSDLELERHGVALFEGLYLTLSAASARPVKRRARR
jgi:hypothetical protein